MKTTIRLHKKHLLLGILILVPLIALVVWFNWPWKEYTGLSMRPEWTVAENIMESPSTQIFAIALYSAGYTTFLQGEGPFTIFVPSDSSYGNLSPATRGFLSNPENEGESRQMLLYHVVKGRYLDTDIKEGMKLETVQGETLNFSWKDGYWVINGYSYIEKPNIISKNGIIHMTTNFILPPSMIEANDANEGLYEVIPAQ